jgi:sugar-specific transcriptional regulator TrmB
MDKLNTLKKLGLTEKQAEVYLAMLELGEAGMTEIAKKANLKRPTVYLIIDELNILGLTGEIIKGKKKFYSAVHPKRLVELAKFRAEQANNILPELVAIQSNGEKPKVRMIEGMQGVMIAYQEAFELFSNKEEGLWISNIGVVIESFPEVLQMYEQIIGKIKNPKIRELIHGNEDSKKWVEKMNAKNMKNYEARYLKDSMHFGHTDQLIIGNKIITFCIGRELFVLIVESADMAQSQRALFEMAWKNIK